MHVTEFISNKTTCYISYIQSAGKVPIVVRPLANAPEPIRVVFVIAFLIADFITWHHVFRIIFRRSASTLVRTTRALHNNTTQSAKIHQGFQMRGGGGGGNWDKCHGHWGDAHRF